MPFFGWGDDHPISITETIIRFKELAIPLIAKGDSASVNHLFKLTYTQLMKGRKKKFHGTFAGSSSVGSSSPVCAQFA